LRVPTGLLQPLLDQVGDGQRRFGPDARLDAEAPGQGERVTENGRGPVEDLVRGLGGGRVGAEAVHHVVAEIVAFEKKARAEMEAGRFFRLIAPVAAGRVLVAGGVAEADGPVRAEIALPAYPDGGLGVGGGAPFMAGILGVSVEAEEVHPELGQLAEEGFVVLEGPPIGALGKIVEGLDAADGEERVTRFVKLENGRIDRPVGDDVALEGEADAQLLGQLVGSVEDGRSATAGDQDDLFGPAQDRLEAVVLGTEPGDLGRGSGVVQAPGKRSAPFQDSHGTGGDPGKGLRLFENRELPGRQVEIATDLGRGGPLVPRGVIGDQDLRRRAFAGAAREGDDGDG
jgi:hypothetical protein